MFVYSLSLSEFINAKQRNEASLKLQTIFRKTLYKARGPATIRTMILAKRALLPKLKRARERIAVKSADQLLVFLQDLKQLGGVRFAIRRFKKQNLLTQRLFRSHAVITRERINCLTALFKTAEKIRFTLKIEEARQQSNLKQGRLVAASKKKAIQDELAAESATTAAIQKQSETRSSSGSSGSSGGKTNKIKNTQQNRKRIARKFVDKTDPRLLKRIEKHVHAMAEAEEMHKEAISTRIPRLPVHIRRQVLVEYLRERRREHVSMSNEEQNYHGIDTNATTNNGCLLVDLRWWWAGSPREQ